MSNNTINSCNELIDLRSMLQLSGDGQKMVLQLVLPHAGTDTIKQEPPITPDYIHYGKKLFLYY